MLNKRIILNIIGLSVMLEGAFLLFPVLISLIYHEQDLHTNFLAFAVTFLTGTLVWLLSRSKNEEIGKREAYIIVPTVWVVFSAFLIFWDIMCRIIPMLFLKRSPDSQPPGHP